MSAADADADDRWTLRGTLAVIATMHGKEPVIAEALAPLALAYAAPPAGFDTDRFGTFTRDVARAGGQLDAARAKANAALAANPQARVAIASEGAFGPHPELPLLPGGHELVLLLDRATARPGWNSPAATGPSTPTTSSEAWPRSPRPKHLPPLSASRGTGSS